MSKWILATQSTVIIIDNYVDSFSQYKYGVRPFKSFSTCKKKKMTLLNFGKVSVRYTHLSLSF